jgi:hypothetical protein
MNETKFNGRLKLLGKILLASNLLDLFFYDSTKPFWANALSLGFTVAFGALISWGILRQKNWARILVYFSFALAMISVTAWEGFSLPQKAAFTLGCLPFLALIYHFHRYPAFTMQYFRAGSMQKKWKIAAIALGSFIVLLFGGITLAGLYFRQQGASLMTEMKSNLVLEGTVDPKIMDTCKEKFGRKIEDAVILEKFCHCFSLNMDKVTASENGGFVTRSVALTMACWPAEAPPMKGLSQ